MIDSERRSIFGPVYTGLFVGVIVGGLGLLLVLAGGWRIYRRLHAAHAASEVRSMDQ